MENILEIRNLNKGYKGFSLDDVSFSLPRGYIMGLIGPNGAGKTTIIKLIMNIIIRDSGTIQIFGNDNLKQEAQVKSRIGFVCDEPHFYEDVKLHDIKSAYSGFYETWDDALFLSLIEDFELPLKKKFKTLSQGMRIKFTLALALSHHPELLVMDEPTTGLDPVFRHQLLDRLSHFIENGQNSVLFSTHITSDLETTADFVTFVHRGRVMFSETLDDIRDNWAVAKGGEELLTDEYTPLFSGLKKSSYGVEALTSEVKTFQDMMPSTCVLERASLEDIMYFVKKEGRNGSKNHTQ